MACDLCGKVGGERIALAPELTTPLMATVCHDCDMRLNKRLNQLRSRALKSAWRKLRIEMWSETARGRVRGGAGRFLEHPLDGSIGIILRCPSRTQDQMTQNNR